MAMDTKVMNRGKRVPVVAFFGTKGGVGKTTISRRFAEMVTKARELLSVPAHEPDAHAVLATEHVQPCPCCGGRMHIIEVFAPGTHPTHCSSAPAGLIGIDTS